MGLFSNILDSIRENRENRQAEKTRRAEIRNDRKVQNAGARQFANSVGYANGIDVNAAWAGSFSNSVGSVSSALGQFFQSQQPGGANAGGGLLGLLGGGQGGPRPNNQQPDYMPLVLGGGILALIFLFTK